MQKGNGKRESGIGEMWDPEMDIIWLWLWRREKGERRWRCGILIGIVNVFYFVLFVDFVDFVECRYR